MLIAFGEVMYEVSLRIDQAIHQYSRTKILDSIDARNIIEDGAQQKMSTNKTN